MLHETPSVQLSRLLDGDDEESPDDFATPPAQAFRRGQSRVYHASEWVEHQECIWAQATPKSEKQSPETVTPEGGEEWQLIVSGHAGPPSHKSQDSGFSDSESEASPHQLEFKPVPKPAGSPAPGTPLQCSTPKAARTTLRARIVSRKSGANDKKKDCKVNYGRTLVNPSLDLLLTTRVVGSEVCRDPVERWLQETRSRVDAECMTTLQGKAIASRLGSACSRVVGARDAVRALQQRAHVISAEFAKLCQHMELDRLESCPPLAESLIGHVHEFVQGYQSHHAQCPDEEQRREDQERLAREEASLVAACDRLLLTCNSPDGTLSREQLALDVASLGHSFTRLVDRVLSHEIKGLVWVLEQASPAEIDLRSALASIAALGLEGSHLCKLIIKCGAVRALLAVCLDASKPNLRIAALRTLAIICGEVDAVRHLDQGGGIEILADILTENQRSEEERAEAASVLTQASTLGVDGSLTIESLPDHLDSLVSSLSQLASETKKGESLLLALAALTNLSFLEPRQCVMLLVQKGVTNKLLNAVRSGVSTSLFVQEQAATLLANMAAVAEARAELAESGRAVVALLCFLQIRSSPLQRAPEISAAERVQQKSAIALSRLCSSQTVAQQIVDLQGAERLVRLCKDEKERNHSDGVLVACLSALRKIASHCGSEVIEKLGAQELVAPRLLDSFLLYSSRQESYV
ncbi:protein inscuteable homolog [Neocloeon triangulifer]|uniref:protein inscuteable homolog n=1 Tax=Neocloeon triangulifer TaxID=2078957 RepID=UPI00286F9317|nr:protein inscuteable homolog [Neocloeon triangulifer]